MMECFVGREPPMTEPIGRDGRVETVMIMNRCAWGGERDGSIIDEFM
jgi:hypothetical protein